MQSAQSARNHLLRSSRGHTAHHALVLLGPVQAPKPCKRHALSRLKVSPMLAQAAAPAPSTETSNGRLGREKHCGAMPLKPNASEARCPRPNPFTKPAQACTAEAMTVIIDVVDPSQPIILNADHSRHAFHLSLSTAVGNDIRFSPEIVRKDRHCNQISNVNTSYLYLFEYAYGDSMND